ncbi:MAG: hypothetical protein JNJ46_28605 [Myxococcales bacterium]|nr:hypothetical protein [Myxococcales bacterium]
MRRTSLLATSSVWIALSAFAALSSSSCGSSVQSPEIAVSAVSPQVVCGSQLSTSVQLRGEGFTPLTLDSLVEGTRLKLPQISLSQAQRSDGSPGGQQEIALFDGTDPLGATPVTWQSAQQMTFTVYPGMVVKDQKTGEAGSDLDFGLYSVSVRNPDQRMASLASALAVVQPPSVSRIVPTPSCNAQAANRFTVDGAHFLSLDGALPSVTFTPIQGTGSPVTVTASSASACTALPAPAGLALQDCTQLAVDVAQSALPPDTYQVVVKNPGSAGCSSVPDAQNPGASRTVLIPPPTITSSTTLAVCALGTTNLQITGTNFLLLSNPAGSPVLELNGLSFPTTVDTASCQPVSLADAPDAQLCTALTVSIPTGAVAQGSYQAVLRNPGQNACVVDTALQINVVGAPTLDAASVVPPNPNPRSMCTGGGQVSVTGRNIYSGGRMVIGGVASPGLSVTPTGTGVPQTATATLGGPIPVTGAMLADLTIENVPGVAACSATLPQVETVTAGPVILFVDPPVVPSIITLRATIFAAGVSTTIREVRVYPAGSNTPVLTFNAASTPALGLDPVFINRAYLTLEKGKLPAGMYDLRLDDSSTCSAYLPNAFRVVTTPTLTVTSMTPAFGSTAQNTASAIAGSGFISVPRAYLSPNSGVGTAQSLSAVTFNSATSLNSVVRANLTPQAYDLVVVNANGTFGLAARAFTVTTAAAPPPVITGVAPASLVQNTPTDVALSGSGFRAGATLQLTCYDTNNAVVNGGMGTLLSAAADGLSASVRLTAPNGTLYCTLRYSNSDGSSFTFSAVGVTGSSLNLTGFKAGNNLTTPRRALAAVAGRPTAVARYVYAIAGDNGADNAPKSSIEAASTALDGTLGAFFTLTPTLPKSLSFPGAAVLGRFIYVVGGFDGTAASRSVYRAEILSPLNAPQFSDANYILDSMSGVPGGLYIYRIAAVLNNADANNPSGETLASDFFPVQVPTLAQGFIRVQLFWPAVPNAASYKIFRTQVNGAAGSERLLATVSHVMGMATQTTTDQGNVTPAGAVPLPIGTTGSWSAVLPQLASARIGAAVAAARDPDPGRPDRWYLYAAGGATGTPAAPTALSSVEFLPITVTDSGTQQTQTVGTWTAATATLTSARWAAPAMPATAANNSKVMGAATYLYVGGGSTNSVTNLTRNVDVGLVLTGGQIGLPSMTTTFAFADSGANNLGRPAYGGLVINNQMMAFGGFQAGSATTASVTAQMVTASTLSNFNSLGGGVLLQPRALQGTALESAFIYQLGGANAGVNSAQSSTEQTIW